MLFQKRNVFYRKLYLEGTLFDQQDIPDESKNVSTVEEIFSFEDDEAWLKSRNAQTLDPDLGFFTGIQYLNDEKPNFGIFLDSSPDRWGRTLMDRREAAIARSEGRQPKNLFETDYLLGV